MEIYEFLKQLTDPESIILYGGFALLLAVIFAETGLFVGFFLPGDSLVFISGLICVSKNELLGVDIFTLLGSLSLAAILGNIVGYWFGYKVGDSIFLKKDSLLFKKSHIKLTQKFYEKNGGKTLVLGRFLPIIRTFAPILAGVVKMNFAKFMVFNVVGAVAWISSLGLAGYYLGTYQGVQQNIGLIVISFIIITLIPLLVTYFKKSISE